MTQKSPLPLSVFIICRNEADRIGPTIEAVRAISDDIVVIDSGSTDGTQAVAAALGARVIERPFPGYGEQKRFGETQCRHEWMLNVDADEVVPARLADEIRSLWANGAPECDAYAIRIAEIFPGEGEPHRFAYTLAPVRLYRKSAGSYSPSPVHDRVDLVPGAKVGHLHGVIHHYSVRSLGAQIAKLNAYTDRQVEDLDARGMRLSTLRLVLEFPANFLKAYFGRRHVLRGTYGFMTAMNYAFFRYMRIAKHMEARLLRKNRDGRR
ncbi:glycosyltransferase family 2 protein [Alsobacter sp. SYSU M60028]|uniref:Glycosyltransferase family 2 protein n=1 Tax=Alsobacter ponti TaxID=2962936 RepID=A0ABT1L6J4_9HYPH|nr:glycosyltransferase family 2 protein [Alsobacter ponti]MCP8937022.1 glycosyltransferase family 2 protein [Alsobacter ponti]